MKSLANQMHVSTFLGSPKLVIPVVFLLTSLSYSGSFEAMAQTAQSAQKKSKSSAHRPSSKQASPTKFLRIKRDDANKPQSMQTAITRFRPSQGDLVVDLIGVVHIGESNYYKQLNDQFEKYDAVLYELVAPRGTRIPKGGKRKAQGMDSPLDLVSWMQSQAQTSLGLESQLKLIDYQKSNLVHADLSPKEMGEKMSERGDTPLTVGLSALTEMMRQQNKQLQSQKNNPEPMSASSLLDALGNPSKMKLMMAQQFAQTGVMDTGLGSTLNQMLITDRNEAAMKVLQKQIANGQRKIAIFYGAAHMPDFEKRLAKDFGLKKTKQVWLDAWDLTQSNAPPKSDSASSLLLDLLNELGK